ncbi:MAG: sn-glycerol-3-phosphate ABC transporter ATP-binding protein UgpC [Roseitalea sp.]|jgi:multiple sugar transport system ATP-binding protein|nr:sn-glycerol-3-phosphate ABC transporter ATP-binding protein UgpC [Roseitalea sp.]MBO6720247.1 sn-glycerol-3-phosphate ABC transporter ATP-binding protein UgpC [Roseitalea sp.]MBO6742607.1 sn-glycerol-3-phosphate ABC transporter ATP-binding protein UgpC [Roseitalea sp.]
MAVTELRNVSKSFGSVRVIEPLDLTVENGEFMVIVGPSGCGKSTLLRMVAGLEIPSDGQILIDGTDVTGKEPSDRGVAMVFQTYALYPHMTVRENMAFGLEMAGMPKAERERQVLTAARTLQLEDYLDRKPRQLSGGQRQRVAIGRTIVRDPKVFLFDEPLSNLDAELRVQMRLEIAKLHRELGATMIYVTHDQVEAMTLATRIVVLRDGRIEQVGTPSELYADPDSTFVAGFIGSPRMNLVPAMVQGGDGAGHALVDVPSLGLKGYRAPLRDPHAALPGEAVFGVRPEDLIWTMEGETSDIALTCEIVEDLGSNVFLYNAASRDASIVAELPRGVHPAPGDTVRFRISDGTSYLFTEAGVRI